MNMNFLKRFNVEFDFFEVLNNYATEKGVVSHQVQVLKKLGFTDTIVQYVECGFNLKDAAEKAFVHRNTIKYRFDRISDMLDVDMRLPKNVLMLYFAIKCEEFFANGGDISAQKEIEKAIDPTPVKFSLKTDLYKEVAYV